MLLDNGDNEGLPRWSKLIGTIAVPENKRAMVCVSSGGKAVLIMAWTIMPQWMSKFLLMWFIALRFPLLRQNITKASSLGKSG